MITNDVQKDEDENGTCDSLVLQLPLDTPWPV